MLYVENLYKSFSGLKVVQGISFTVNENEIYGLVGSNGAGKTTTFNLISGFLKPTDGKVMYQGQNIVGLSPDKIAKMGIVRTFQQTNVLSEITVLENMKCAHFLQASTSLFSSIFRGQ